MLDDAEIDAVYIPLPSALRTEWVIKSAKAKKHVLAEKPMPGPYTDQELVDMINACKENNVQFLDGTMWLHSDRTKEIKKLLFEDKKIGEILRVNASFCFKAPNEAWLNGGNGRTDKTREPMGCFGD